MMAAAGRAMNEEGRTSSAWMIATTMLIDLWPDLSCEGISSMTVVCDCQETSLRVLPTARTCLKETIWSGIIVPRPYALSGSGSVSDRASNMHNPTSEDLMRG